MKITYTILNYETGKKRRVTLEGSDSGALKQAAFRMCSIWEILISRRVEGQAK